MHRCTQTEQAVAQCGQMWALISSTMGVGITRSNSLRGASAVLVGRARSHSRCVSQNFATERMADQTHTCYLQIEEGVGNLNASYAYDGHQCWASCGNAVQPYGKHWKAGGTYLTVRHTKSKTVGSVTPTQMLLDASWTWPRAKSASTLTGSGLVWHFIISMTPSSFPPSGRLCAENRCCVFVIISETKSPPRLPHSMGWSEMCRVNFGRRGGKGFKFIPAGCKSLYEITPEEQERTNHWKLRYLHGTFIGGEYPQTRAHHL